MKNFYIIFILLMPVSVFAASNCNSIKNEIDEKIKNNNVATYTLEVVDKGTSSKTVVGSCGGGTKDIVYERGEYQQTAVNNSATDTNNTSSNEQDDDKINYDD